MEQAKADACSFIAYNIYSKVTNSLDVHDKRIISYLIILRADASECERVRASLEFVRASRAKISCARTSSERVERGPLSFERVEQEVFESSEGSARLVPNPAPPSVRRRLTLQPVSLSTSTTQSVKALLTVSDDLSDIEIA